MYSHSAQHSATPTHTHKHTYRDIKGCPKTVSSVQIRTGRLDDINNEGISLDIKARFRS